MRGGVRADRGQVLAGSPEAAAVIDMGDALALVLERLAGRGDEPALLSDTTGTSYGRVCQSRKTPVSGCTVALHNLLLGWEPAEAGTTGFQGELQPDGAGRQ